MRKAAVRHGDPTTTHGFVIAYSSKISDKGKKVALSGDEATCGTCEGAFKLFGTGKSMSEKGRAVVLDGDRVLCPCGKNRVIVGSHPGVFIETDHGPSDSRRIAASTAATSTAATSSPTTLVFDEQVCASVMGVQLPGYPYYMETADGRIEFGRLDASGRLPRIASGASAAEYTVYWGDEALAKQVGGSG
ncbi:PAAR domain-containing protein [Paraburkholderia sp. HP33-1]|uniref:PAAR domain-containing protein n=1 Tax=Paraburkholderia sp. HP33-1 TaxID=2883243 RepID=UPI001F1B5071|nr:PAAR domain-containing protein [Paraburkholderia sp. HP33-1]